MREAHEEAVQKAVATFNAIAVGTGSARQKYEKCFHTLLRKAFEVIFCDVLFRLLIMLPIHQPFFTIANLSAFALVNSLAKMERESYHYSSSGY